ncbi:glycosyltransferase family 2 protein [Collinsella sp. AF08-23]|nr:glycosyltransferase family 2 protein [Collinsella sp. AF08-23]
MTVDIEKSLVSIVMPLYNAEPFLAETINSIIAQTYKNWELIIVDDCSTDSSLTTARRHAKRDSRIRVYSNAHNMGAAKSRNAGLKCVKGDYLAFMDADDVWVPEKLEHQLAYMKSFGLGMCFTSYETIESDGSHRNYVHVPKSITYDGFLKNTITCSHTIAFDLSMVSIKMLVCPDYGNDFDFPEDMVVWLQVLKNGIAAGGLDEVLAKNRKHRGSRSSNKLHAVARTWNAYRKIERINPFYATYCLFWQLTHAVLKRI